MYAGDLGVDSGVPQSVYSLNTDDLKQLAGPPTKTKALQLRPDFAEAHYNLGHLLKEQGQFAEAVASLQEALRLKPDFVEAHYCLGVLLQEGYGNDAPFLGPW